MSSGKVPRTSHTHTALPSSPPGPAWPRKEPFCGWGGLSVQSRPRHSDPRASETPLLKGPGTSREGGRKDCGAQPRGSAMSLATAILALAPGYWPHRLHRTSCASVDVYSHPSQPWAMSQLPPLWVAQSLPPSSSLLPGRQWFLCCSALSGLLGSPITHTTRPLYCIPSALSTWNALGFPTKS